MLYIVELEFYHERRLLLRHKPKKWVEYALKAKNYGWEAHSCAN